MVCGHISVFLEVAECVLIGDEFGILTVDSLEVLLILDVRERHKLVGVHRQIHLAELLDKILLSSVLAADARSVGLLLLSKPLRQRCIIKLYPVFIRKGFYRGKLLQRIFCALHGVLCEGRARIIHAVAPICAHAVVHCHLGEIVLYLSRVHVEPAVILAPCDLAAIHRGDDLIVGMESAQRVIVKRRGLNSRGGLLRGGLCCLGG